ncbi:MAG: aminopeptidase [Oscillospiraceae bacterium]|nr:aminopeptidase [Oscillospiraceae bacterium]
MKSAKELQKELTYSVEHISKTNPEMWAKSVDFCEAYKDFLSNSKTERESVTNIIEMAKANGYEEYCPYKKYNAGDKVYINNRNRALMLSTIGQLTVDNGTHIVASHIDVPRLDLKPMPMYEASEIGYLKTHYYGGVKRYQWAAMPLAIHGVIYKEDGTFETLNIGENENDPVFYISDLLPHLAKDQRERKMGDVLRGEEMNVIVSSLPFAGEGAEEVGEAVKLATLVYLNETYGLTEKDFLRAEIEVVPAGKARDVGFDRSMIAGYGHDDRVCAYTSLMAELETKNPTKTTVTIFADKEEIGSTGATGLCADYFINYIHNLALMQGVNGYVALNQSKCLSADVGAAYDPTFADAYEARNSCYLNKGAVLTKYTGSGGKGGTNDCGAEFMAEVIALFDEKGGCWQSQELGKIDQGGGGTVARYIAEADVTTVDIGVPVIAMHAPWELVSKLDVYATYEAFVAFLNR